MRSILDYMASSSLYLCFFINALIFMHYIFTACAGPELGFLRRCDFSIFISHRHVNFRNLSPLLISKARIRQSSFLFPVSTEKNFQQFSSTHGPYVKVVCVWLCLKLLRPPCNNQEPWSGFRCPAEKLSSAEWCNLA